MKILRVSGVNITTFDNFEIDFEAEPLSSCGLFAITGATGAGKSTLLDAICLALYGRTPRYSNHGGIRIGKNDDSEKNKLLANDPRALMSYGAGFAEVNVDFTRDHQRRYRAKWYAQRARKKPEGSIQNVTQELYELEVVPSVTGQDEVNEKLLEGTKVTDVRKKIEECIGLKYEEFCRTVFLAQGEFDAFLKREEERSKLLELITGDQLYSRISQIAAERLKNAEESLAKMRSDIDQDLLTDDEFDQAQQSLNTTQHELKLIKDQQKLIQRSEFLYAEIIDKINIYSEKSAQIEHEQALLNHNSGSISQEIRALFNHKELLEQSTQSLALKQGLEQVNTQIQQLKTEDEDSDKSEQAIRIKQTEVKLLIEKQADEQTNYQVKRAELKHLEEKIAHSEKQLASIQAEQKSLDHKHIRLQDVLGEIEATLTQLNLQSDQYNSWIATHSHSRRLIDDQPRWEILFDQLDELSEKSTSAQHLLSDLEAKYTSTSTHINDLETEWAKSESQRQDLSALLTKSEATLSDGKLEEKSNEKSQNETLRAQVQLAQNILGTLYDQAKRYLHISSKLNQHHDTLNKLKSKHTEIEVDTRVALARLQEVQYTLKRNENEYLLADLREALVDGTPCPLCGSEQHSIDELESTSTEVNEVRHRIETLSREKQIIDDELSQLNHLITQEEQAILWLDTQKIEEQSRTEAKLIEWNQLYNTEEWRNLVKDKAVIQQYSRLVFSDISLSNHQTNTSLLDQLSLGLQELEDYLQECHDRISQQIAEMNIEHSQLATLQNQLKTIENNTLRFEERKISLEEELIFIFDKQQQIRSDLDRYQKDDQHLTTELSQFSLETLTEIKASDYGKVRSSWLSACHEWKVKEQEQQQRSTMIIAKSEEYDRSKIEYDSLKSRKDELIGIYRESSAELQQYQSSFLLLKPRVDRSLEGHRELQLLRTQLDQLSIETETIRENRKDRNLKLGGLLGEQKQLHGKIDISESQHKQKLSDSNLSELEFKEYLRIWQSLNIEQISQDFSLRQEKEAHIHQLQLQLGRLETELSNQVLAIPKTYSLSFDVHDRDSRNELILRAQALTKEGAVVNQNAESLILEENKLKEIIKLHQIAVLRQDEESQEVQLAIKETNQLRTMVKMLGGSGKYGGFNAFAQKYTLEMIIEHANHYLLLLKSRYQLQMIEDDKKPLNFQVIDQDLGDEIRSVNSLSGGESFLISLALALGLSSTSSQQTHIESLFIDEGFGSLDPDSLDLAITMLDNLQMQGIQIGVISHVDGIAERVGTRLEVKNMGIGKSKIQISQSFQVGLS